jgi:hypothetical protein
MISNYNLDIFFISILYIISQCIQNPPTFVRLQPNTYPTLGAWLEQASNWDGG